MQRKVVNPNDFFDPDQIAERLAAFEDRYNTMAEPFDWRFGRDDLNKFLSPPRASPSRLTAPTDLESAAMAIPDQARCRLEQRLELRRRERWRALRELNSPLPRRLRLHHRHRHRRPAVAMPTPLHGSPDNWGFACYLASKDGYEESILPTGSFTGTPEEALDCACGLYLNDPTSWISQL